MVGRMGDCLGNGQVGEFSNGHGVDLSQCGKFGNQERLSNEFRRILMVRG